MVGISTKENHHRTHAPVVGCKDRKNAIMSPDEDSRNDETKTLAACYTKIGNVLSNDVGKDYEGAIESYYQALESYQRFKPLCEAVADLHDKITTIMLAKMDDEDGACKELAKAESIRDQLSTQKESIAQIDGESVMDTSAEYLGSLYAKIGDIKERQNDYDGAIESYRKALGAHGRVDPVSEVVAILHNKIANIMLVRMNDSSGALKELSKAKSIRNRLSSKQSADAARKPQASPVIEPTSSKVEESKEANIEGTTKFGDTDPSNPSPDELHPDTQVLQSNKSLEPPKNRSEPSPSVSLQGSKVADTNKNNRLWKGAAATSCPNPKINDEAVSFTKRGLELSDQGDFDGALEAHRRALEAYKRTSPCSLSVSTELELLIATEHNNIGLVFSELQRSGDALREHQQALRIQNRISSVSSHVAKTCSYIGDLLDEKKDYGSSLRHYERAASILQHVSGPSEELAQLFYNAGAVSDKQYDLDSALSNYKLAAEVVEKIDPDSSGLAELYRNIAAVLEDQQMLEEAVPYYQNALAISNRLRSPEAATDIRSLRGILVESSAHVSGSRKRIAEPELSFCGATPPTWSPRRRARRVTDTFTPPEFLLGEQTQKLARERSNGRASAAPAAKKRKNDWTDAELKTLRNNRTAGVTYGEIARMLPRRTEDAVGRKCRKLGIVPVSSGAGMVPNARGDEQEAYVDGPIQRMSKHSRWTVLEDRILRESRTNEPKIPYAEIAKVLNRPENSCMQRASELGFTKSKQVVWTEEEIAVLRAHNAHGLLNIGQIAELLPGKSIAACRNKLNSLLSQPKLAPAKAPCSSTRSIKPSSGKVTKKKNSEKKKPPKMKSQSKKGSQNNADDIRPRHSSFARPTLL